MVGENNNTSTKGQSAPKNFARDVTRLGHSLRVDFRMNSAAVVRPKVRPPQLPATLPDFADSRKR